MAKLYCYVDETGQDTGGAIFSVCCALTVSETSRDALERLALDMEQDSRKRSKWQKTDDTVKHAYLNELLRHASALIASSRFNIFIVSMTTPMPLPKRSHAV